MGHPLVKLARTIDWSFLEQRVGAGARRDFILATAERRVRNWHRDAVALLDIAEKFAEGVTVAAIAIGAHGCDNADECNSFPWRRC